ncbi:hypothetical protein PGT21_021984 [Puccinia graminis f. sp. tritici]|uniref:Uncharacterized protein n=1 Tax=Puccinia graminis f. sp. tritici TaxID=56615 RepID=A0A5B0QII5_PUCGR|nr:hypothetical protein PGT21_021984 [Puccinia graminis f. sp. tritici]
MALNFNQEHPYYCVCTKIGTETSLISPILGCGRVHKNTLTFCPQNNIFSGLSSPIESSTIITPEDQLLFKKIPSFSSRQEVVIVDTHLFNSALKLERCSIESQLWP